MNEDCPVAVASRSFSRHPILRSELLERYSDVRFNDEGLSLRGSSLIDFAKGRRKLIVALEPVDEALLAAAPELEVVSKYGVGTDNLDTAAMIRHGIRLGWVGGVNRRSVTELTIALMISLLRHVPRILLEVRAGTWQQRKGRQLGSCTVGIIGCGNIGKDLTVLLKSFGATVIVHDIVDYPDFYDAYDVEPVGLDELLRRSDIVTLHVPLDDSTRNMLSRERLSKMKNGAILVNAARGGLVDEAALSEMLADGRLGGAALDVFATEPPQHHELFEHPDFMATSHIGGSSEEAVLAMGRAAIAGLDENALPTDTYPPRSKPTE